MATNTYVALDTKTLTSNATSVVFTSINQGYTDLILVCNSGQVTADTSYNLRVGTSNSIDTGNNYSDTALNGNGSTASSYRNSSANRILPAGSNSSSIVDNLIFHIQNYSNTNTHKTVLSRANVPGYRVVATVSLWRNTAAINTLEIYGGSNLLSGSTFTLYGIANSEIGAPKAFGGTITQDANYTYHTFGASGTFTPTQSLTADILCIAGGGGGGTTQAGGGGAGGLLAFASQGLTATNYTVTVGSGGAGSTTSARGINGSDSQFGALTLVKGGGGAGSFNSAGGGNQDGATGGSGGGGGTAASSGGTGGAATSGQGSVGGNGGTDNTTFRNGGGGGGAGGAGVTATSTQSGTGGAGLSTYSSWASVTGTGVNGAYAGGGGGGGNIAGTATAGGGIGATNIAGANGVSNTGGGGGGGGYSSFGAGYSGGSGIVIIRYAN